MASLINRYRRFATDSYIEIVEDKESLVGLKAVEYISHWYPEDGKPSFNVLTSLPIGPISPEGFVDGGRSLLDHVILRMSRKLFERHPVVKEHWSSFAKVSPKSDDVTDYLKDHPFHIPLHDALLEGIPIDPTAPTILRTVSARSIVHAKDTVRRKDNATMGLAGNYY